MTSSDDQSDDVARICGEALDVPEADRVAYVRHACAGNEMLRQEVEAQLS